MDKEQFILSTVRSMAEHTFPFLASVVGVFDDRTGESVGSGIRCLLSGRRVLVTALHVIEKASTFPSGFALSRGYGRPPYVVHGPVHFDRAADLAVYTLPDDYADDLPDIPYWSEHRIQTDFDRLATDYLFSHGFPEAQSGLIRILEGVVSRSMPYGAMQRLEGLPSDLDSFQFALEFDPGGMRTPDGLPAGFVDPHGLSGSPVWRIGISGKPAADWAPSHSLLVGILTQWRPDERVLVASSLSRIPQLRQSK